jgi:hypothetical protein
MYSNIVIIHPRQTTMVLLRELKETQLLSKNIFKIECNRSQLNIKLKKDVLLFLNFHSRVTCTQSTNRI